MLNIYFNECILNMSPAVRCPRDIPDGPDGSGWIRMDPDGFRMVAGWLRDGQKFLKFL